MKNISLRTSGIIIIGNEILSGRTQELNSRYLAQKLLTVGVTVNEVRIIPDVKEKIIECVNEIRKKYTFVFTSGGIGPTHDDITSECIASAFGVDLPINIEAKKLLENYYKLQNINQEGSTFLVLGESLNLSQRHFYRPLLKVRTFFTLIFFKSFSASVSQPGDL